MLLKFVSFIAAILLMITPSAALPEIGDVPVEVLENLSETRTADEINGANGTKFYIQRPADEKMNVVYAADFGLSAENDDNFAAFQSALNYCALNPQTRLVIDKGTYYFESINGLDANNCTDLLIEGNDATFVFSSTDYRFLSETATALKYATSILIGTGKKVRLHRLLPFRTAMRIPILLTLFSRMRNTAMKTAD